MSIHFKLLKRVPLITTMATVHVVLGLHVDQLTYNAAIMCI